MTHLTIAIQTFSWPCARRFKNHLAVQSMYIQNAYYVLLLSSNPCTSRRMHNTFNWTLGDTSIASHLRLNELDIEKYIYIHRITLILRAQSTLLQSRSGTKQHCDIAPQLNFFFGPEATISIYFHYIITWAQPAAVKVIEPISFQHV